MTFPETGGFESAPKMRVVPSENMLEMFEPEVKELSPHIMVEQAAKFAMNLETETMNEEQLEKVKEEAQKHFNEIYSILPFLENQADDTEFKAALEVIVALQKKLPSLHQ